MDNNTVDIRYDGADIAEQLIEAANQMTRSSNDGTMYVIERVSADDKTVDLSFAPSIKTMVKMASWFLMTNDKYMGDHDMHYVISRYTRDSMTATVMDMTEEV